MDAFQKMTPFVQAGVSVFFGFLFMLGCLMFESTLALRPEKPWVFASTFLIFYSIFNVILSLGAENSEKYWTQSVLGFVGAVAGLGGLAYLVSGLGMDEAGSFKWIFIVVTISYLVFMSIVRAMKGIVQFAEREEWHQPKLRKRKRRE